MTWNRVEVAMPESGERVLFCVRGLVSGFVGEGYCDNDGVWYRIVEGYRIDEVLGRVSEWMTMPVADELPRW